MVKRRLKVCSVEDDQGQPREEPTTQYPIQPQVSLSSHQPNATSQILVDDVDQIIDAEVEICVEDSSGSRKTRGVTRMSDIWNLSPEMRILVKFLRISYNEEVTVALTSDFAPNEADFD